MSQMGLLLEDVSVTQSRCEIAISLRTLIISDTTIYNE